MSTIDREALGINNYGGKAGPLLYTADGSSQIPQPKWISINLGENSRSFLARMIAEEITGDILLRSNGSSEFDGDEGRYPTINTNFLTGEYTSLMHGRTYYPGEQALDKLVELMDSVRDRSGGLIAAQKSPSRYHCVLVGHPGNPDQLIATVTNMRDNVKTTYLCQDNKIRPFSKDPMYSAFTQDALYGVDGLEESVPWYKEITSLPAFGSEWSYQLELGLKPAMLYQIRLFRQLQRADFKLEGNRSRYGNYLVFGTTPPEGLVFDGLVTNRTLRNRSPLKENSLVWSELRSLRTIDGETFSIILEKGDGVFQHEDTAVIRRAQLAVVFAENPGFGYASQESKLRIISDGMNVEIETL